jgi:preprotein translocase subunit SecG
MELPLGIALLVMAIFIVVAVLLQSGKEDGLSGSIAGGADTFFAKSKTKTLDKVLSKATLVVAILFAIIVVLMYAVVLN